MIIQSLISLCILIVSCSGCPQGCQCLRATVNCSYAQLESIPRNIPPNTVSLNLRANYIRHVARSDLSQLVGLRSLDLSQNLIRSIEPGAFEGLRHLEFLYLSRNRLERIDSFTFMGLSRLESVNLQHNRIRDLSTDAFRTLQRIRRIYLSYNRIRTFNTGVFDGLSALEYLNIRYNPTRCTCPLSAIAARLPALDPSSVICKFPLHYRAQTLHRFARAERCPVDQQGSRVEPTLPPAPSGIDDARPVSTVRHVKRTDSPQSSGQLSLVSQPPAELKVNEGSILRLRCQPSRRALVAWYFNDADTVLHSGAQLEISSVRPEQSGVYTCKVDGVEASTRVVVTALSSPTFTIRPLDTAVTEGSRVQLSCEALGFPTPIISWLKDGDPVRQTQRLTMSADRTNVTIYPLLRYDTGRYTCRAVNNAGVNEVTATITLLTSAPPELRTRPSNVELMAGERAVFRCSASGEPEPDLVWMFDGSPIPTVRGHYEITDDELAVNDVTLQDAGHYTCQAVNQVGAQMATATLKVKVDSSGSPIDSNIIQSSVAQAIANVDQAINGTKERLFGKRAKTPSELLALFRFPGPQAIELARAREIYEQTLDIVYQHVQSGLQFNLTEFTYHSLLSDSHLSLIQELTGCFVHRTADYEPCTDMCFHQRYRSPDGTCNNLRHDQWGASFTGFKRILPPIYENGFNQPVGWNPQRLYHGYLLPNARLVSSTLITSREVQFDELYTHMLMQWGQFIDHDMDFAVAAPSTAAFQGGSDCERHCGANEPPCFNIDVPVDDPRYVGGGCIEFERSSAVCGSGQTSALMNTLMHREQVNAITSYIDASNIYGSNVQDSQDLRDLFSDHGLLKFDVVSPVAKKPYLPFNRNTPMDCQRNSSVPHATRCFLAGDYRANEQLGLTAMHTVWLREHNYIASRFLVMNPHWDGEKIYHETRKIVGAQLQHITYAHWLPKILGGFAMHRLIGPYMGYNPDIDASVSNAFATAAFRFGHSLISPTMDRLNSSFQPIPQGNLMLHQAFFAPERLLSEGGVDPILRGLIATRSKLKASDSLINRELTEKLFSRAHQVALDLAALNIQRGRDHALPSYVAYRRWCNLSIPIEWLDLKADIKDINLVFKLQQLYGHLENVDLWTGGLAEDSLPGARVGPTFACIIADQFKRLRDGDRFWYENPGVFSAVQLAELRRSSLAAVLCRDGDAIEHVQPDVFMYGTGEGYYKPCKMIDSINFNVWQECCNDCTGTTPPVSFLSEAARVRKRRDADTSLAERLEALETRMKDMIRPAWNVTTTGLSHEFNEDICTKGNYDGKKFVYRLAIDESRCLLCSCQGSHLNCVPSRC